jgi:beta-lactam-binding protein with PASTA domain
VKLWKFLVLLGAAGLVAAVLVAGINFLVLPSFVHAKKVVTVPDLRGASPQAAADLLRPLSLSVEVARTSPHATMRAGLITDQVPPPSTGIRSGRTVKVVVCGGPATTPAPDLVGQSERQAGITLERDAFQAGRVARLAQAGLAEPTVVGQEPQPGTRLYRGATVSLAVADPGPALLLMMPDLRGQTLARAKDLIEKAGLKLGRVRTGRGGGRSGNTVLEQRPAAGRRVARGDEIELVASSR